MGSLSLPITIDLLNKENSIGPLEDPWGLGGLCGFIGLRGTFGPGVSSIFGHIRGPETWLTLEEHVTLKVLAYLPMISEILMDSGASLMTLGISESIMRS